MNAQEAILKIKALFEDAPVVAPVADNVPVETKVELMEYDLEDGSKVMIDKLEVGGKVTLADGSNAPAGEHKLADGTSIYVDENANITQMEAPVAVDPTMVDAAKDEKYNELASKFNELLAATQSMYDKYNELEGKVKQGFESVASLIEALSVNPTADPVAKPNSFKAYVSTNDIKEQRINKFRNAILNK